MEIIQYGNYWVSQELGNFKVWDPKYGVLATDLQIREALKLVRRTEGAVIPYVLEVTDKFTVNGTDGVLWDNLSLREAVKRARRAHRIDFSISNRLGIDGYEACEWSPLWD